MTHVQAMVSVILPQALRNIIPQIGNNFIINIKDTSVLSVITFTDLFFVHKSVAGSTYLYFPSATITMLIYLTMTLIASILLRKWEAYLDGAENYDLAKPNDTLEQTSGLYPGHTSPHGQKKEGEKMSQPILKVRNLSKSFGSHEVLKDVSMDVCPGDVTSIIGLLRLRQIHLFALHQSAGNAQQRQHPLP